MIILLLLQNEVKAFCVSNTEMSRFLFLIATAICFCSVTASVVESSEENDEINGIQPYVWENRMNETLRNLSISLMEYDPYFVEETNYIINSTSIRGEATAKKVLISGFSNFDATNIQNNMTFIPLGVISNFNIKFKELQVIVPEYFIDGMAVFVPFYGKGSVKLVAKEINGGAKANARIVMSLKGKKIKLKSLEIKLNISQTDLVVTGILNNEPLSQIVSTSASECFFEFVNLYNDRLGKLLGARLIDPINKILNPPKPKSIFDDSEENYDDFEIDSSEENDYEDSSSSMEDSIKVGPYNIKVKITP